MRDGTRLQTVILRPVGRAGNLPMLLRRTPYGVPEKTELPEGYAELAKDGYILVFQNLRGRFKSEGEFIVSTKVDLDDPKAIDEATDAYDTIDWLVSHVPANSGKVGMIGISYSGLTAGLALLRPHPALKAVSDQAAPTDLFLNDDIHRYGALRLSYAFEYAVLEQSEKNANAPFAFDSYDTYEWYLRLGSVANAKKRLGGNLQAWNDIVDHPDRDAYWKAQAWAEKLPGARIPTLTVAGFWDQEDPWGPWQVYRAGARRDPEGINQMVAGPWTHGSWALTTGDRLGNVPLGQQQTGVQFRRDIQAPFFRFWLFGRGAKPAWQAKIYETGSNVWREFPRWPPVEAQPTRLYFHSDGSLSFTPPGALEGRTPPRSFVSDPANPVPYRPRPITPTFSSEGWATWETLDQRFVDHRPDVLTYVSAPLDHDVRVDGEVSATLIASTSGSDGDLVLKLIDVYPENATPEAMRGYQLPIAMEVRRGRYLTDYARPQPLTPDRPTTWPIPLRDRAHMFLKGHRIMVQVQASWFPVIDRNPQKFLPNIYAARDSDFVPATNRIYAEPDRSSFVTLPIVPQP
ncbi:CocE/NonD family hydrolase [Sphingomonas sp. BK580]|uniref:CocE/NonD family hydrolase n=1 Tax=Sphingomonas sp. BK580 TaxID=2586972 RepID=UPI00182EC4D2|nr:CocE/NonD family hydrolase [Sphingomonas sp. BK580]MBB3695187.1 hypothetical protein [Sphingomonas sp. BK580]